jgi:hypothetical protein
MSTIYDKWASDCLQFEDTQEEKIALELQADTREHFKLLGENKNQDGAILVTELSTFIKKMEPSFSRGTNIRKYGLLCFLGALEGIGDTHGSGLPFSMMKLLSNFLLQHCGPIESATFIPAESMDIDLQSDGSSLEKVRDVSLNSIGALLRISMSVTKDDKSLDDFIELRMRVAQRGIQLRCASIEDFHDEDDDENDDYYEDNFNRQMQEEETKILSGLSLLPRAKRSMCFRTLDAALSGITHDCTKFSETTISKALAEKMVSFATFTAATLHGETDPRCLVLLLKLLKRVQEVLIPLVESKAIFPFTKIFDACAVYYPVRFSPPPNDPHGITREMISDVLLEVFSCSSHFEKYILGDAKFNLDSNLTMQSLAVGLVLERLSPSPSDDAFGDDETNEVPTVSDRLDAIQDLKYLLFVPSKAATESNRSIISLLSEASVKNISHALMQCHEEAATVVATNRNDSVCADNKRLADDCRHLITSLVYEIELNHSSLWDSFVKDSVQSLSSVISSSPQSLKGRMAIAYLASLSAGGGEKTLRYCLDMCLPFLLGIIDEGLRTDPSSRDVEKVSTAAYGISTLFSSCRLSMEQLIKDGINVHPHPLAKYATNAVQKLSMLLNREENLESASIKERNEVDVAAVKALESVLQSTPAYLLVENCSNIVRETVFYLSKTLTENYYNDANDKFLRGCSHLVGSMIGKALQKVDDEIAQTESIFESVEEIKSFAEESVLPNILQSCFQGSNQSPLERHDFYALAYACETDQCNATSVIVSAIYQKLIDSLKERVPLEKLDSIIPIAEALSYVMKNGGPAVIASFHETSSIEENDILHLLAIVPNYELKDEEAIEGMSNLLLPETKDQYRSEAEKAIALADKILPCILDAYKFSLPEKKLLTILSQITNVLPPLSDADEAELSVYLPVLGTALTSSELLVTDKMMDQLLELTSGLTDFSLNPDHNSVARSAAGSCLYFILSRFQRHPSECRGLMILHDKLCPQLVSKIQLWNQDHSQDRLNEIEDLFKLMSIIGCAAAWRGGISATTADEISRFFVLVACRGAACAPALGINVPIDFIGESSTDLYVNLPHLAASSLGSILNIKDGSPFARQRLAHLILPIILSSTDDQNLTDSSLGTLLCADHVVCCVPMTGITQEKLVELTHLLVSGLFKCSKSICDGNRTLQTDEVVVLTMTSIMRMYENFPFIMRTQLDMLLPTLVLLCISSSKPHEAIINIISLQMLLNITKSSDAAILYFCEAYKDTVIMHLRKVLDHPSAQVRHAAVIVRNAWCVIGV